MDSYECQPATRPLDATVTVPGSKSITNRALMAAALADGHSLLTGILLAEDTRLMIGALRALGIAITVDEQDCAAEVTGCRGFIHAAEAKLSCGNAGTVMRFCAALAALGHGRYELSGTERMHERPIGGLITALQALGSRVEYLQRDEYPPLIVHASGLGGGRVSFRSPESSQFVSAVLMASPYAARDVLIEVTGALLSIPYLKLTTKVMDRFGVAVVERYEEDDTRFIVEAPQRYKGTTYAIEPDASSAGYFLAAPAVAGGCVTVKGLGTDSIQGDARLVDLLERMGCQVERLPTRLTVFGPLSGEKLRAVDVDMVDMPDMALTLAVLALFADGPTTIRNVASLRVKESDRLASLHCELAKLGAEVEEWDDGMRIDPPEQIRPAVIDTHEDHRLAMSFALAGLCCPGIVIRDPDCCAKTFPDFFERFEQLAHRG